MSFFKKLALFSGIVTLLLGSHLESEAATRRYRISFRDDPSTTAVIGWDQASGSNPVVYYDSVDHGQTHTAYSWVAGPDRAISHKGMANHFVRLTGLQPDTEYYFLIRDSDGNSDRMWFSTLPDDPSQRLSLIAGGDSRSNQAARVRGNQMVSRLAAHAVLFGGDYTNGNTSFEWQTWMDDWQNHISPDGRLTPIIGARGNHEGSNADVYNLFDVPTADVYYALNLGGSLLRAYTLNSEISQTGFQATWLANDLQANQNATLWKFAQYHRPCRPHYSGKSDQNNIYDLWIPEFEDHGVNLVIECDAHVVKRTYPILKGTSGPSYAEGFYRDDSLGVVYVGEGTWAPLRTADDGKAWTRDMGSFNSFKWIWVDQCEIQLRTVMTDNVGSVAALDPDNRFAFPANLEIWNPANGPTVTIPNPACGLEIYLAAPSNGATYPGPQTINLEAVAFDLAPGTVSGVDFFVNGQYVGSDNSSPYSIPWTPPANGTYSILARCTDNDGYEKYADPATVQVGQITVSSQVSASSDDAEEGALGAMYLNSSDLEMSYDGVDQVVGIRFNNITIPQNATIDTAYIQFTVDEVTSVPTYLTIRAEAEDNPPTFSLLNFNISGRTTSNSSVGWNPVAWAAAGDRGSDQRTPGIDLLVQELVDRPGWNSGNSMVFLVSGSGERVAESFDGVPAYAPQLVIQYSVPGAVAISEAIEEAPSVMLGPVPARDWVLCELADLADEAPRFSLFDMQGRSYQLPFRTYQPGKQYKLLLPGVPAGVYWVRVETGTRTRFRKLVVQ